MKVLIIDNYDSFTYNLYQQIGEILENRLSSKSQNNDTFNTKLIKSFDLQVKRNDELNSEQIRKLEFDKIIISPGPGDPSDKAYFGICSEVILELGKTTPVFGVCLGMQGICHYFGGNVIRAKLPMHGKTSLVQHIGKGVFENVPQNIEVMRYHSLVAEPETLPDCLEVSAWVAKKVPENRTFDSVQIGTQIGLKFQENIEIMGLRHKKYPIEGIQFHPESFATEAGQIMLKNFLYT